MLLYAERAEVRVRQVAGDVAVPVVLAGLAWVASAVHDAVAALAEPSARVGGAAREIAAGLEGVEGIPIVGPVLAGPLGSVADASREVELAAVAQGRSVLAVALLLGLLTFVPAAAWLVSRWFRARVAWAREATGAAALRDGGGDLRVLALRGLARAPLSELLAAAGEHDPLTAALTGDGQPFADRELARLGLRDARRAVDRDVDRDRPGTASQLGAQAGGEVGGEVGGQVGGQAGGQLGGHRVGA